MIGWLVNNKFETVFMEGLVTYFNVLSWTHLEEHKTAVRIAGLCADVCTSNLQNIKQEC
jgi:hypothetical protein